MTDMDQHFRQHIKKESDDILFAQMELSDRVKQKIWEQAVSEKKGRLFFFSKKWKMGMAVLAVAVMMVAGYPMLQQLPAPSTTENLPPSDKGAIGSELSQLVTTKLNSEADAKAAFGDGLLVPSIVPEGYTLSDISAVGVEGEPVRDVIFTYISAEKTVTFSASNNPAAFPVDMFTQTKINGADGFIFAQSELTELFWLEGGIQYSLVGQLSADEAIKVAESLEP